MVSTYLRRQASGLTYWENTDLIAPTATISSTGLNLNNFKHGIGNIRKISIPQNYLSLFQYTYTYVMFAPGGRPVFLGITGIGNDCQANGMSVGSWDSGRYHISTLMSGDDTVGKAMKPIGCQNVNDFLHHIGCELSTVLSLTNCAVQVRTVPPATANLPTCQLCNPGYGFVLQSGSIYYCTACPANCLTCEIGGTSCRVCAEGYVKTKSASNYVCTARNPAKVYNPALQTEFVDAGISAGSFTYNAGTSAYESVSTVSVASTGTVAIEAYVSVPYSSSEDAKYDIDVYIGGQLVQVRTVPFLAGNPGSYTVKVYAVLNNQPANANLEVKIAAKSAVSFTGTGLKAAVQTYNTGANCMLSNSAGDCLVCNTNLGFYLTGTTCTAIPTGKYSINNGFAVTETLGDCFNTPAVTACTGPSAGQATACAAAYYLTSGNCDPCDSNCATCATSSTYCLTCTGGTPLLQSLSNTCVVGCNSNQYVSSSTCLDCDTSCLTCSAAGSTSCQTCASGKYLSSGSCLACNSNCVTCTTSATNCLTCGGAFPKLQPGSPNTCVGACNSNQFDNSGTCTNCDPSCLTCTGSGTTACSSCVASKFLTGSNSCQPCDANCATCSTSSTNCLTCTGGTPLLQSLSNTCVVGCNSNQYVSSSTCLDCDTSCLTCSAAGSTSCSSCAPGKYLNGGSCSNCDSNCLTCSGSSVNCVTCGGGTPLFQPGSPNTCVGACNSNQFDNSGTCTNCDPSCLTCIGSGPSACSSCAQGKYLNGNICIPCNPSCLACSGGLATECTSCPAGKLMAPDNSCQSCDPTCLTCTAVGNTGCSSCAAPRQLTTTNCAGPGCCFLCDISNCLECSADTVCSKCSVGYVLSGSSSCSQIVTNSSNSSSPSSSNSSSSQSSQNTTTSTSNYKKITITTSINTAKWLLNLRFSDAFQLSLLKNITELKYDNSSYSINFTCFESSSSDNFCSSPIDFVEGVSVTQIQATLEIKESVKFEERNLFVPSQSFQINEPVSYYVGSKATQAAIQQSFSQSAKVAQASQGLAIFSSSGSFSGFIKLTQSIEMVVYFNLFKPQNYEEFLKYFSQNIFSMSYNPMDDIFNEDCTLPWAFEDNGFSCSFLENTGGNFLIFGTLIMLKMIIIGGLKGFKDKPKPLRIFQFFDQIISLNLLMVLVDALMFDYIVAAMVSFKTSTLSSPASVIDFLLSVGVLGFYLLEMVFIFFYCKAMYSLKDHSKLMPHTFGEEKSELPLAKSEMVFRKIGSGSKENETTPTILSRQNSGIEKKPLPFLSRFKVLHYVDEKNVEFLSGRYSILIDQAKTLFCTIILVVFFEYPLIQIGLIGICQTSVCMWYIFRRPHSTMKENIKCIMTESMLATTMVLCALMTGGSTVLQSPADRYLYLGYPLIAISSILFITILSFNIYETIHLVIDKIKGLTKSKDAEVFPLRNSKIIPEKIIPIQNLKEDPENQLFESKGNLSPTSSMTTIKSTKIRVTKDVKLAVKAGLSPTLKPKKLGSHMATTLKIKKSGM